MLLHYLNNESDLQTDQHGFINKWYVGIVKWLQSIIK